MHILRKIWLYQFTCNLTTFLDLNDSYYEVLFLKFVHEYSIRSFYYLKDQYPGSIVYLSCYICFGPDFLVSKIIISCSNLDAFEFMWDYVGCVFVKVKEVPYHWKIINFHIRWSYYGKLLRQICQFCFGGRLWCDTERISRAILAQILT